MTDTPQNIDEGMLRQLRQRAQSQGVLVNHLLANLLELETTTQQSPYAYLDAAPSAITIVDVSQSDQPAIYVNRAFERETGYSAAEVIGRNLNFLQGDDREQAGRTTMREAIQQSRSCTVVLRNYRKDGSIFWNEIHLAPLPDEQGNLTRYIGIQNDVTERIEAQKARQQSEEMYRLLAENSQDAISLHHPDGRFIYVNPFQCSSTGYTSEELLAMSVEDLPSLVHPDDLTRKQQEAHQQVLRGETVTRLEYRLRRKDGSYMWVEMNSAPIMNERGEVEQILATTRDITERKQFADVLRERERQLRWLIQNIPVLVNAFDVEKHITVWNAECERVTGYRADEIVENPHAIEMLYPDPDYRQHVIDDAIRLSDDLHNREYTLTCKDGSQRTIRWSHIPAPYSVTGGTTWAIGVDVTEQHRAERALRASEEKYRLLVEHSYQGIMVEQSNPIRIAFASQSVQRILGYSPDEMLAMDIEQLKAITHPDDWQPFVQHFQDCLQDKDVDAHFRVRSYHANHSLRYLDVYRTRITYEGEPATQTVFLDVTEQVEVERLKTRFQKEQEKNALVQRVVSMLSHDLRTPLAVITSSRDMLHRYFDRLSDEAREEKLDSIGRQVRFAIELLEDAVNTVRGPINTRELLHQPVNLAMLCQISVDEIREAQDGDHDMQFIDKGSVETVSVDEVLVSRILVNLLSNAIKYSPVGSEIRLELDQSEGWIILRVSDQGMGISEGDLPHIFDPFYRADEVHQINGTGLGLNIVKDCVDRHQGRIHVESKLGQGSTFTIELPMQVDSSDQ